MRRPPQAGTQKTAASPSPSHIRKVRAEQADDGGYSANQREVLADERSAGPHRLTQSRDRMPLQEIATTCPSRMRSRGR
jgi:hypothetical protein